VFTLSVNFPFALNNSFLTGLYNEIATYSQTWTFAPGQQCILTQQNFATLYNFSFSGFSSLQFSLSPSASCPTTQNAPGLITTIPYICQFYPHLCYGENWYFYESGQMVQCSPTVFAFECAPTFTETCDTQAQMDVDLINLVSLLANSPPPSNVQLSDFHGFCTPPVIQPFLNDNNLYSTWAHQQVSTTANALTLKGLESFVATPPGSSSTGIASSTPGSSSTGIVNSSAFLVTSSAWATLALLLFVILF